MADVDESGQRNLDRRSALKKAALAAGAAAWASPVIQTLGADSVFAAVTNCHPDPKFVLVATAANCDVICTANNIPNNQCDHSCCNNHTFYLSYSYNAGAGCGSGCPGALVEVVPFTIISATVDGAPLTFVNCNGAQLLDAGDCARDHAFTAVIQGKVRCPDGKTYTCTFTVRFVINTANNKCVDQAPGTVTSSSCV